MFGIKDKNESIDRPIELPGRQGQRWRSEDGSRAATRRSVETGSVSVASHM